MKTRPILFSAPMVRALLDGRKTQTRRIVKEPDNGVTTCVEKNNAFPLYGTNKIGEWVERPCPYGKMGDLLWVRESYSHFSPDENCRGMEKHYWADGEAQKGWHSKKIPSIHMPRFVSRITLEIAGVRVERLQDISENDAIAEGCPGQIDGGLMCPSEQYAELWSSLHGKNSWAANPWVWVLEFKVHQCNVDALLKARHAHAA